MSEQVEARRVSVAQIRPGQQFALVEPTIGVNAGLIIAYAGGFLIGQELKLGDTDTVLARDDTTQIARDPHDACDGCIRFLQHQVIVGVDRDIGVHVAIPGMHVQCHPHAALEDTLVNAAQLLADAGKGVTGKDFTQWIAQLLLPADPDAVILQTIKDIPITQLIEQISPATPHLDQQRERTLRSITEQGAARQGIEFGVSSLAGLEVAAQEFFECIDQSQLVGDRELDIDALDGVGVIAEPRQRDHDVFVDLEGVGVFGDRRCTGAIEPEFLAGIGADGDKALTRASIGKPHHIRGGACDRRLIVTDDIADQYHLGPRGPSALGCVAHGFEIALIQVLESRKFDAVFAIREG